ncbi:MAG TPA: D-alanyl-D-alanine carboxypeptidase/D-alanyl-D-alanine-endopeptidase [Candidatus Binatus sp.]|jgi:D-alanyl-D-alanine carboxypeptidase/D-alanyl-D-alanine-endopeptidase (penicillin-binding protein 4)|nr:D-alanyl-D-alanine carboxypeptidase/D-alanyl-D-alanine-endopeptidase [Candidatus Binatus sp.]
MNESLSSVLHRFFFAALVVLLAVSICARAAQAQNATTSPKKVPAKRSAGVTRPDLKRFRARLDAALGQSQAQKTFWGISIVDGDNGETLYELNADKFVTPASNAKIFTTALALSMLGPDFRFHTTLQTTGLLGPDGRLIGDLVLVGNGDPDLSNRKFPYAGKVKQEGTPEAPLAELVEAAVAKGLKEVDGDIIADDSYFPYDPYPAGWSVGDLFFTFGAPVSALAFNDNSFSIEVSPAGREGEAATLRVEPAAANGSFAYELNTASSNGKPDFSVVRQPGQNFVLLRGSIPAGHAPIKLDFAMSDPGEVAALGLKQTLESRGIKVTGGVRVRHSEAPRPFDPMVVPAGARTVPGALNADRAPATSELVLADHISPTLLESIRVTNKVSQNLHAELFLRTVAREKAGIGSTEAGIWVEQNFLKTIGIADGDVVLSDGSGLSRDDLVTPRAVVQLLRYISQQPWGADYIATLPIAGVDGTLENRMKETAASGRVFAKTGSLEHVRAMSGYATTVRGEHLLFTIFGNNNAQGHDATVAMDAIAVAMVETLGTSVRPNRKNEAAH